MAKNVIVEREQEQVATRIWRRRWSYAALPLMGVLLLVVMLLAVSFGSTPISIGTIAQIILNGTGAFHFARHWDTATALIIWQIRMPIVVAAALVGAALSVAGVLFQG